MGFQNWLDSKDPNKGKYYEGWGEGTGSYPNPSGGGTFVPVDTTELGDFASGKVGQVEVPDLTTDPLATRRANTVASGINTAAANAGAQMLRSSGLSGGSAGGAARSGFLRVLGAGKAAEARDQTLQDERDMRLRLSEDNMNRRFGATSALTNARFGNADLGIRARASDIDAARWGAEQEDIRRRREIEDAAKKAYDARFGKFAGGRNFVDRMGSMNLG